ncbi:MAG: nucleotide sugar dehydrogenase [Clostridiales bacterium]|nr:nucleotide sugar dehydrogenase [Clostridiales bacterium]
MELYDRLIAKQATLSVIGLGYVGLPIAVAFAKKLQVIGYDSNTAKVAQYMAGRDATGEVGDDVLAQSTLRFSADATALAEAEFHIVAVPTPVYADHSPDLRPLRSASETLGKYLRAGSIVVYESTVYPGVTEEICVPILERESNLVCGRDFFVGYSPERINPGDRAHRLESIIKIVSGMDEATLDTVARVYELVVYAGVHRAPTIRVAEAAKVIENSQRDINIAFMNELSLIFDRMGIDTKDVLAAAGTKWNFLQFYPGLVGGHCIGVDPYYLTYKAEELGYASQVILAGRRINDGMGKYVAERVIDALFAQGVSVGEAKIAILGLTFKENCPDTRNTRVTDIIEELRRHGIRPPVCDPVADAAEARAHYGLELVPLTAIADMDAVIIAVAHEAFRDLDAEKLSALYGPRCRLLADIKGILNRGEMEAAGYTYWRL